VDLGIADKVALVSGGSKAMGRAIAEELGREGCRVVVTVRGQEAVDETVAAIRSVGGTAIGVLGDFTKKDEIERIVATAKSELGPVEIAVFQRLRADARSLRRRDRRGPAGRLQRHGDGAALDDARRAARENANKWGRLVTINSISSKEVHRDLPLFTANLRHVAAVVRQNAVRRGRLVRHHCQHHGHRRLPDRALHAQAGRRTRSAVRRVVRYAARRRAGGPTGLPRGMAAATAFLCSARASYMTGQFVVVDGGNVRTLW
jgi:3-oxoacyl-[acyl-carrier protein] reductase